MKLDRLARIKSLLAAVVRTVTTTTIVLATIGTAVFLNVAFPEATFATPDISSQVSASAKDISQVYATMAFDNTVIHNYFGKNAAGTQISSAMVFTGITIPAGCYIYQAYITFKADASLSTSMAAAPPVIYGEDAAAPADYAAAEDFTARTYTTASVSWTPASWTSGTSYYTPDLTAIVQELYNSYAPYAAGSMAFEILGTAGAASAAYRSAYSWDCGTPTNAPTLVIEFAPINAYWVGGAGDWSDGATHWAASSGGAPSAALAPYNSSDVFFDTHSNEPTDGSYIATIDAASYCHDITTSNPPSGILTIGGSSYGVTISGSMSLGASTIWTNSSLTFNSTTSGETITTNGIILGSANTVLFNSAGGGVWTLQDNFTRLNNLYLWGGTLNTNGMAVTTSTLSLQNSPVLNLGTTHWIMNSIDFRNTPTINAGTSVLTITDGAIEFTGLGKTYYDVIIQGITAAGLIAGSNTYHSLTLQGANVADATITIPSAQTITGAFTSTGYSASHRLLVKSNALHIQRTITAANTTVTNTLFRDIVGAGADDWDFDAQTDVGDCGGNTNVEFPVGINVYASQISGNVNWSNALNWASASNGVKGSGRVPLPQDIAVFDDHSMGVNGIVVTLDNSHISGIDTTLVTHSPQFDGTTEYFYNSIKNGSGLWNTTTASYMLGQGTQVLAGDLSYGNGDLYLDVQGGSVGLSGDLIVGDDLFLTSGIFETTGYDVTAERFDSSTETYTRALWMGDSIYTLNDAATATKWYVKITGLNIDSITSTIVFTNSNAGTTATFTPGAGIIYNNFTVQGVNNYTTAFSAAATFDTVIIDRSQAAKTISGAFILTVSELAMPIVGSTVITVSGTDFTKTGGGIVCSDWLDLTDSAASPVSTFYAGTNSHNHGTNTNWSFTSCIIPTVTTGVATDIALTSAKLNGNLTGMGSFTIVYGFFQYDSDGTFITPMSTAEQTLVGLGVFHDHAAGLNSKATYIFRVVIRYNVASYVYGAPKTFYTETTVPAPVPGTTPGYGSSDLPNATGLDAGSDILEQTTSTDQAHLPICGDMAGNPGYPIIHTIAVALNTSGYDICATEMMLWYSAGGIFVLIVLVGLLFLIPGHLMIAGFGGAAVTGLQVSVGIFPWWAIGIAIMFVAGGIVAERANVFG